MLICPELFFISAFDPCISREPFFLQTFRLQKVDLYKGKYGTLHVWFASFVLIAIFKTHPCDTHVVPLKRQEKGQPSHCLPRATDAVTGLSFIFETRRADFRSSYRKTQCKIFTFNNRLLFSRSSRFAQSFETE